MIGEVLCMSLERSLSVFSLLLCTDNLAFKEALRQLQVSFSVLCFVLALSLLSL